MTIALELLKAMLGIAVVLGIWLLVQRAWLLCFPSPNSDADALAGRTDCHSCSCESPCENNQRTTRQDRAHRIQ